MSVRSLCVLCFVWAGWILGGGCNGVGVNSEISIDDPKTVKECRVHIEKALEEYWDKTEPNTDATRSNIQLDSNPFQETDDDNKEETPCADEKNSDQNDISESNPGKDDEITESDTDEDDDDDSDDEDDTEAPGDDSNQDAVQGTDQPTSDSDVSENESQNDPGQSAESQTEESSQLSSKSSSSETKAPSDEAHETRRVYVVKNLNKEPIEFDDLKTDKVDEDKQKGAQADTKSEVVDDNQDDDNDDDDDETDDQEEEADEGEGSVVDKIDEDSEVLSDEQKDEGKDASQEGTPTVEEVIIPEATKASESSGSDITSDQTKPQINGSELLKEKEYTASEIQPSVVISSSTVSSQSVTETPEVPKKAVYETPEVIVKSETGPELTAKDELIENIYEDEDDDDEDGLTYRNRAHVDAILGLDEVGTELEKEEEKLAQSIFKDIKKIELSHIRPMELLYKFADSTTRSLGDAEIFNKPMILFLGPWNSGKTSIINYILGIERTASALETGTGITDVDFTVITHGPQRRVISGTELVTDWRYSGVQKFGQGFMDHFRSIHIPHALLQKVTIVDSPGILENRKSAERGYSLNDAFQWFIDRADAIYVVLDPNKVDIGGELAAVVDQLKGREARFVLNKADSIRRSDLMRVVGQLFWNLSPLMSGSEAPVIYAVSLTTHPYHPSAPTRFLDDQEKNLLYDMRSTLDRRVENRILYARRHAVRVRNHAKMVDCYLATFYRHKSIFSNKRNVAKQIVENPAEYSIYDGVSGMSNVSRYDLPSPALYKDFFRTHALYDFKPLASTCSYFRGCPMDKLDEAIAKDIPEMMARFKKAKIAMQEVTPEGKL